MIGRDHRASGWRKTIGRPEAHPRGGACLVRWPTAPSLTFRDLIQTKRIGQGPSLVLSAHTAERGLERSQFRDFPAPRFFTRARARTGSRSRSAAGARLNCFRAWDDLGAKGLFERHRHGFAHRRRACDPGLLPSSNHFSFFFPLVERGFWASHRLRGDLRRFSAEFMS